MAGTAKSKKAPKAPKATRIENTARTAETPREERNETMTTTEMFEQFTDPRAMLQTHRKLAMATFDNLAETQIQARKLVQEAHAHSMGELDTWLEPMKHASEQITATQFDLHERALETARAEVERWYDAFTPA